ncbi:MAG: hypothetical protein OEZ34_00975, partial [Spirochaetia bacterium]|nr:hypothetical protein [Spirochaetia bacterium]
IPVFILCLSALIPASEKYSFPIERSDIRRQLIIGGEQRRKALWYIYQLQYNDLLRSGVMYLFKSSNYDDHRAVIKVLQAYGENLESHLPDWHNILDQYMRYDLPEDILKECFELILFWQEQKMSDTLSRFGRHPSMQVRFALFDTAAKMENDVMMPVFIRLFNEERPIYRMYALEATKRMQDKRLLPFMVKLLDDENKSIRIYAMEALASNEKYTDFILRRFSLDKNNEVRARVIQMVAQHQWRKHTYMIHRGISDPSATVRRAAFLSAQLMKDLHSAVYISNQLETESDESLKNTGLDFLMSVKNGGGGSGISEILLNDKNESLRLKAALAAGVTFEKNTAKALIESIEKETSQKIRLEIVHSMGNMKNTIFLSVLQKIFQNPGENFEVRVQALNSMIEIDSAYGIKILQKSKKNIKDPILLKQMEAVYRQKQP